MDYLLASAISTGTRRVYEGHALYPLQVKYDALVQAEAAVVEARRVLDIAVEDVFAGRRLWTREDEEAAESAAIEAYYDDPSAAYASRY